MATLQSLQSLYHLILRGNRIVETEGWLANLVNLRCLDLSFNPIRSMPACLPDLHRLQHLAIIGSDIISIDAGIIRRCLSLEVIQHEWQACLEQMSMVKLSRESHSWPSLNLRVISEYGDKLMKYLDYASLSSRSR